MRNNNSFVSLLTHSLGPGSFPYAFRSTRGGLDSFAGWDSERKKRKDNDESSASLCAIL